MNVSCTAHPSHATCRLQHIPLGRQARGVNICHYQCEAHTNWLASQLGSTCPIAFHFAATLNCHAVRIHVSLEVQAAPAALASQPAELAGRLMRYNGGAPLSMYTVSRT